MSNKSNNLPKPKLRKVYLKSIHTDTERYQVRNHDIVDWHVAALVKVLKDDTPLDPLYVRDNNDGTFMVLNGHHSLQAYQDVGWSKRVPVKAYKCTDAEAALIAIEENSKVRLPMSSTAKSDFAWKLTVEHPEVSIRKVHEVCGVSTRQVSNMRKVKKSLLNGGHEDLDAMSWREALDCHHDRDEDWSEEDIASWEEAVKNRLMDQIRGPFSAFTDKKPELALEAVQEVMGRSRFTDALESLGFAEYDADSMECVF